MAAAKPAASRSASALPTCSHVKSSVRTGTGAYQVVFNREAKTCIYLALRDGAEPGQIAAVADATNANAVNVTTFTGGNPEDRSFNLALSC